MSEELCISMQQRLFSNLISIGLSGKLGSNGFTYATPLPVIICLGVNDVLFGRNISDTIPVFPGSMCILFLTVNGIKICWRYSLCDVQSCHAYNCAIDVHPKIKS